MITTLFKNTFFRFIVLFLSSFLLLYYGIQFITGLAVVGGWYSPFVEKYFNIASGFRTLLIVSSKFLLSLFSVDTIRVDDFVLRKINGNGIRIVYACLGFAVLSFWAALIIATKDMVRHKLKWLVTGLLIIFCINIIRISLVLVGVNKGWSFPLGWDHHTWFNIIVYSVIFTMMYFYDKTIKLK